MSKYSELVERLRAEKVKQIWKGGVGTGYRVKRISRPTVLDIEAADAITKLEAEKAELTSLLVLCVDRVEVDDPFAKELVDKARATLAKLEAGQ